MYDAMSANVLSMPTVGVTSVNVRYVVADSSGNNLIPSLKFTYNQNRKLSIEVDASNVKTLKNPIQVAAIAKKNSSKDTYQILTKSSKILELSPTNDKIMLSGYTVAKLDDNLQFNNVNDLSFDTLTDLLATPIFNDIQEENFELSFLVRNPRGKKVLEPAIQTEIMKFHNTPWGVLESPQGTYLHLKQCNFEGTTKVENEVAAGEQIRAKDTFWLDAEYKIAGNHVVFHPRDYAVFYDVNIESCEIKAYFANGANWDAGVKQSYNAYAFVKYRIRQQLEALFKNNKCDAAKTKPVLESIAGKLSLTPLSRGDQ
eukprot:GHVT01048579.1.p1 GENE.GHVT01048579.1~~GHVT01048579.1.p1  ORF type:complete len:314 (+),score=24.58 GHVT01048579.1:1227-2168(+)